MRVLSPSSMPFRMAVGKQNLFFHQTMHRFWAAIIHLDIGIRIRNGFLMLQRIEEGPCQ